MGNRSIGWKRRSLVEPPAGAAGAANGAQLTRIEPGCEIDGTLTLEGPLRIEGEFRGAIDCHDDVTILASGTVEASIHARSVIIEGAVVGDVSATREVVIGATGRLHGNLETPCLAIERGAFFSPTGSAMPWTWMKSRCTPTTTPTASGRITTCSAKNR